MAPPPPHNWAMAQPYHYRGKPPPQHEQVGPAAEDETGAGSVGYQPRSLWIGGLLDWMDEEYLYSCFTRSPELVSVVIMRNKETRKPEGFGFLNFADHVTADQILQSYNGQKMPNSDKDFRLSWVNSAAPEKEKPAEGDRAIYAGGLAYDVTDFMLHNVFKNRYPSVTRATVKRDRFSGHSKGYGFVVFGDVNERRQAMTEMDGAYCSTRPMRIGPATGFRTQGTDSDCSRSNKRLFVGNLDLSMTDEDLKKAFSPYGELTAKVIEGKSCGFVTYMSRASAEEAIKILNGSQLGLGDNTIRVLWARPVPSKQDEGNGEYHGHPQGSGPDYGYCPEDPNMHGYTGHGGYAYHQQKQPQQTLVQ